MFNIRKCGYGFQVFDKIHILGSTLDNIQTLLNMWTFLHLAKLKSVILIMGNFDNTPFNIAWKDETEQYNFVLNLRKCKYDFSVYKACTFQSSKLNITQTLYVWVCYKHLCIITYSCVVIHHSRDAKNSYFHIWYFW